MPNKEIYKRLLKIYKAVAQVRGIISNIDTPESQDDFKNYNSNIKRAVNGLDAILNDREDFIDKIIDAMPEHDNTTTIINTAPSCWPVPNDGNYVPLTTDPSKLVSITKTNSNAQDGNKND